MAVTYKFAFTWQGTWSSATRYAKDDLVYYGGSVYRAKLASLAQNPSTATTYWELFVSKGGTYTPGTLGLYNVADYGALGDGATDDAASVQAAITAAQATGGTVWFERGKTYLIGTKLTITAACTLYGPGATLKLKNATNTGLLRVGPAEGSATQLTGIRIQDLTLDGNKANQTNASTGTLSGVVACLETYNLASPVFENVTIQNAKGVGWKLWGDDGGGSGMAANTLATGIYIYAPSGVGLLCANTKLGRLSDIFIQDGSGIGAEFVNDDTNTATCEEMVVTNLHVHNCTGYGLALYSGVTRMQFSNVQLTLNAGGGILCGANDPYNNQAPNQGVGSSTFTGFLMRKSSPAANLGLVVQRGSKNVFTGFLLADYDTAVYLENTVRNQFSNFAFLGTGTLHINCASGAVDNQFHGLFFAHPASTCNYINVNSGATGNSFRGIDDYDTTKIAVNAAATNTRFGVAASQRTNTSATITVSVEDQTVLSNHAGAVTCNLPANPEPGRPYIIKDASGAAATNNITLTPASGTIDGGATYIIKDNYGTAIIEHDGTNWFVVGNGVRRLMGSATWDVGNLVDGAGETSSAITVTGAALGDFVVASLGVDVQGMTVTAWVESANTVKVRVQNETGGAIDLASTTVRVLVFKQ